MIITGKSPPLLPSSNATVINRNDNQRHLTGYTWIEKNGFLALNYVKIPIKVPYLTTDILRKANTFIPFVKLIIHSL